MSVWAHRDDCEQALMCRGEPARQLISTLLFVFGGSGAGAGDGSGGETSQTPHSPAEALAFRRDRGVVPRPEELSLGTVATSAGIGVSRSPEARGNVMKLCRVNRSCRSPGTACER
jgi:hypothetical protein